MSITIALPKGALLKGTIARLQAIGIDFGEFLETSNRLLRLKDRSERYEGLLVRAQDVPVYVAYGQAQVGVVGFDILKEKQLPVAQVADLGFGYCRLSVAVKGQSLPRRAGSARPLPGGLQIHHLRQELFRGARTTRRADSALWLGGTRPAHRHGRGDRGSGVHGPHPQGQRSYRNRKIFDSTARLIAHPLSYRLGRVGLHELLGQIQTAAVPA